jgi:hypothetical protein
MIITVFVLALVLVVVLAILNSYGEVVTQEVESDDEQQS